MATSKSAPLLTSAFAKMAAVAVMGGVVVAGGVALERRRERRTDRPPAITTTALVTAGATLGAVSGIWRLRVQRQRGTRT